MKVVTCTTVYLAVPKRSRQELSPAWPTPFHRSVIFCSSSSLNNLELFQMKGAYTSLHGLYGLLSKRSIHVRNILLKENQLPGILYILVLPLAPHTNAELCATIGFPRLCQMIDGFLAFLAICIDCYLCLAWRVIAKKKRGVWDGLVKKDLKAI